MQQEIKKLIGEMRHQHFDLKPSLCIISGGGMINFLATWNILGSIVPIIYGKNILNFKVCLFTSFLTLLF
jgi:hypothetical protein